MDRQSKVVIVVLVVLGVICAISLGSGLIPKQGEDQGPGRYHSGWLEQVDGLVGRFSPPLDLRRLKPNVNCKRKGGGYTFSSEVPCIITVGNAKDDYETATLQISNAADIRVPCPPQAESAKERGLPERLQIKPAILAQTKPMVAHPVGAVFNVIYTPWGESEEKPTCQGKSAVRLVVQKAGGTLSLKCSGCGAGRVVKAEFKQ
jgi:hypothetical protein